MQDLYSEDRRKWNALFSIAVRDLAAAERDGVDLGFEGTMWPIVLGNKGDWSYLVNWQFQPIVFYHVLSNHHLIIQLYS